MQRDGYKGVGVTQVIDPATHTADKAVDRGADTRGFRRALLLAAVGASGDTLSGSVYAELYAVESDDNSTFTAVADADIDNAISGAQVGTFAKIDDAAKDDTPYFTGYHGSKRYVGVQVNLVGTHSNGIPIGAAVVLSEPTHST